MSLVYDDVAEICSSKERLIFWLREKELLGDLGGLCFVCCKGKLCFRTDSSFSKDGVCWRCSNGKCNKKLSIREGSWFSKSHLVLEQIVKLTYYYICINVRQILWLESFALGVNTL